MDRDAAVTAEAAYQAAALLDDCTRFVVCDMRALAAISGAFAAKLCLWQKFGHLHAATTSDVLRQLRAQLRPAGRLIVDPLPP
jgi:hypothetical protein